MVDKMTEAQLERIAKLLEECAEVVQICGKAIRFGYESEHNGRTCLDRLEEELGDVLLSMRMMAENGDISLPNTTMRKETKIDKINRNFTYTKLTKGCNCDNCIYTNTYGGYMPCLRNSDAIFVSNPPRNK